MSEKMSREVFMSVMTVGKLALTDEAANHVAEHILEQAAEIDRLRDLLSACGRMLGQATDRIEAVDCNWDALDRANEVWEEVFMEVGGGAG